MKLISKLLNDWRFILLLCLTIGMAPYVPEPHIWGKLKWIAGGAKGMQLIDWFDLFMHGTPWVLGMVYIWKRVFPSVSKHK